eukprot:53591-Amphidinium_carterae.1
MSGCRLRCIVVMHWQVLETGPFRRVTTTDSEWQGFCAQAPRSVIDSESNDKDRTQSKYHIMHCAT